MSLDEDYIYQRYKERQVQRWGLRKNIDQIRRMRKIAFYTCISSIFLSALSLRGDAQNHLVSKTENIPLIVGAAWLLYAGARAGRSYVYRTYQKSRRDISDTNELLPHDVWYLLAEIESNPDTPRRKHLQRGVDLKYIDQEEAHLAIMRGVLRRQRERKLGASIEKDIEESSPEKLEGDEYEFTDPEDRPNF